MNKDLAARAALTLLLAAGRAAEAQAEANGCAWNYSMRQGPEALERCAASVQPHELQDLTALGDIYYVAKGDQERGIAYYTMAAQGGDAPGQFKLAQALKVRNQPVDAWLKWLELSAMQGYENAVDALGSWNRSVDDSKKPEDRPVAQGWLATLTRVFTQGKLDDDQKAQLASRIAYMREHGAAGAPDARAAADWYARAGQAGGYKALWAAARMYKLGEGMPADPRKAQELLDQFFDRQRAFFEANPETYLGWLTEAARLGFSSAAFRLAEIHRKGLYGVSANDAEASRWAKRAEDAKERESR